MIKYSIPLNCFLMTFEKKEAINRLRYEKPNLQICFRSEKSLKYLYFERSNKVC